MGGCLEGAGGVAILRLFCNRIQIKGRIYALHMCVVGLLSNHMLWVLKRNI